MRPILAVHHINSPFHPPPPFNEGLGAASRRDPPPATASRTEKPQRIPRRRPARGHGVAARHPPRRQHHLRPLRPPRIGKPASVPSTTPPLPLVPRTLAERPRARANAVT